MNGDEKTPDSESVIRLDKVTKPHAYFYPIAVLAFNRSTTVKDDTVKTFDCINAAVFCAFTLEAYLNWLGDQKISKWKKLERLTPEQKLIALEIAISFEADLWKRPFSSFRPIFSFRNNFVAHGKPENATSTFVLSSESIHPVPKLESVNDLKLLTDWVTDTKAMVDELHEIAGIKGPAFGTLSETKVSVEE